MASGYRQNSWGDKFSGRNGEVNEGAYAMATIIYILNHFFADIGGEDKANLPVGALAGDL